MAAKPASRERPLTVPDLVRWSNAAVERFGLLWAEGEAVEVKRPSSGHVYFTLKDRGACIPAVLWRASAQRLRFTVEPGMRLLMRGKLGVFDRDGRLQFYVDYAEPAGLGAAAAALEELKRRLASEGLFADQRKRPLPAVPRRIGVVTSRTGAAIRDVVRTIQRRFPPAQIVVADCVVQGANAPAQIVHALRVVQIAEVDVIILGRGGGATADLAAFNDERVVRAVAACAVPVVSAVGHEVDITLCDLVADRRASTPTAAGELVVPVRDELVIQLDNELRRIRRELGVRLRDARQELDTLSERAHARIAGSVAARSGELRRLETRLASAHPQVRLGAARAELLRLEGRLRGHDPAPRLAASRVALGRDAAGLHAAMRRSLAAATSALARDEVDLHAAMRRSFAARRVEWANIVGRLEALSPLRVLERGYSLATAGGHVVTAASQLATGDEIELRFARGRARANIIDVE